MSNTSNLGLPLLQPAQAQKHVTVNEALAILDGVACLNLKSVTVANPPTSPADGDSYFLPAGATNGWFGQDGAVAVFSNGGWLFVTPKIGWRGWIEDVGQHAIFDGLAWRLGASTISGNGATTVLKVINLDHVIVPGGTNTVAGAIPSGAVVIGVTARVMTSFSGTLTSWRVGVPGSDDRYGTSYGLAQGSWARGLTGSPVAYYSDTDLILTGEGGAFASGDVRMAIHLMQLEVPY